MMTDTKPNRISNKGSHEYIDGARVWITPYKKLKAAGALCYRSWHDVPPDMFTWNRARKFRVLVNPEPCAYVLSGDYQTLYPLYKAVQLWFSEGTMLSNL